MMSYILKLLFFLYVPCNALNIVPKRCDDCMVFTKCERSYKMVKNGHTKESEALLLSSCCGFDNPDPKVCCSEWPKILQAKSAFEPEDPIEVHGNVHLLPKSCGGIHGDRIIFGSVANLREFPWMAIIFYKNSQGPDVQCAGTVISSRYILTAAHCVRMKSIAFVRVGDYQISTTVDCIEDECEDHLQDSLVEEELVHEHYSHYYDIYQHDIALLRLKDTIDFSFRNVDPVCLPVQEKIRNKSIVGSKATVSGWGITENGTNSDILKKTIIDISSKNNCRNYLKRSHLRNVDIVEQFLCAGSPGTDTCAGDSGGPLLLQIENYFSKESMVQVGITSQGTPNCEPGSLAAYTNVAKYMLWILDNIKP